MRIAVMILKAIIILRRIIIATVIIIIFVIVTIQSITRIMDNNNNGNCDIEFNINIFASRHVRAQSCVELQNN